MCKNTRQNAASKTHLQGIGILQAWSRAFFQAYCNSLSSCKISTNEFVQFNFFYIQHLNALTVKIFKIHSVIQDRTLSLNGYARAILSCSSKIKLSHSFLTPQLKREVIARVVTKHSRKLEKYLS